MKYVVKYEVAPDGMAKAGELFPEHQKLWGTFSEAGTLLAIGPMADPTQGALGIFTTREAAEAFVADDPFVSGGVVASWEILEWNEVLLP